MNILCPMIKFRIDPQKHPGLLGVVCNDATCWIHHIGVKDLFKDLITWSKYIEQHPDYKGLPSSLSFRSCVDSSEGPYSYDHIYEFAADGVLAAIPLIHNTWNVYNLRDPLQAARTNYLVREFAMYDMASRGDIELTANHILLGLLRYGSAIENNQNNFPEGIDFGPTLRQARSLQTTLEAVNLSSNRLDQELTARLQKGEEYQLEENLIVMLATDAQEFYVRLKKLSGSDDPTAIQFFIALLAKPSPELVEVLSLFQIPPKRLKNEAIRLLGHKSWWPFGR